MFYYNLLYKLFKYITWIEYLPFYRRLGGYVSAPVCCWFVWRNALQVDTIQWGKTTRNPYKWNSRIENSAVGKTHQSFSEGLYSLIRAFELNITLHWLRRCSAHYRISTLKVYSINFITFKANLKTKKIDFDAPASMWMPLATSRPAVTLTFEASTSKI